MLSFINFYKKKLTVKKNNKKNLKKLSKKYKYKTSLGKHNTVAFKRSAKG